VNLLQGPMPQSLVSAPIPRETVVGAYSHWLRSRRSNLLKNRYFVVLRGKEMVRAFLAMRSEPIIMFDPLLNKS
jgi:hypothetical protein